MRWRRIARENVVNCISDPEETRQLPSGEINSWKRVKGEWLRIVHVEEADTIVVVTVVYPAKNPRRSGHED